MNEDTIQLLKEIDSGCLMAINSFHQLEEYDMPKELSNLIIKYEEKHDVLQKEASKMLHQNQQTDKQPGIMASTMSWLTTEMKMMMHNDSVQIVKIMMNGCNMGIQTIGEDIGKYEKASEEAVKLAKKLIKIEEEFISDLAEFLS